MRIYLLSPFSVEECVRRINAATDRNLTDTRTKPVFGWARSGTLCVYKRQVGRNSFHPLLKARLTPNGAGTLLACRIGMAYVTTTFVVAWVSLPVFSEVAFLGREGWRALATTSSVPGVAMFLGFVGFGPGLMAVGRWMARSDVEYLVTFVRATLEAVERKGPMVR